MNGRYSQKNNKTDNLRICVVQHMNFMIQFTFIWNHKALYVFQLIKIIIN